jgi:hypothetical protein
VRFYVFGFAHALYFQRKGGENAKVLKGKLSTEKGERDSLGRWHRQAGKYGQLAVVSHAQLRNGCAVWAASGGNSTQRRRAHRDPEEKAGEWVWSSSGREAQGNGVRRSGGRLQIGELKNVGQIPIRLEKE